MKDGVETMLTYPRTKKLQVYLTLKMTNSLYSQPTARLLKFEPRTHFCFV